MQLGWLLRTINYWNKLVANKANSELLMDTLTANTYFGLVAEHDCWVKELHNGLCFVAPEFQWKQHLLEMKLIDNPKAIVSVGKRKFCTSIQEFDQDPTDPDCPNRHHNVYRTLMHKEASNGKLTAPEYIRRPMQLCQKQAMARFRLSNAPLRANLEHRLPLWYQERLCQRCDRGQVDNEHHMMCECPTAGLVTARQDHSELCFDSSSLHDLMELAYHPDMVDNLVNCISSMLNCIEG